MTVAAIIAYVGSNIAKEAQVVDRGRSPIGWLDVGISNCTSIRGWACDQDQPNTAIDVHIYTDGPAGAGNLNVLRPFGRMDKTTLQREGAVGAACGQDRNQNFSINPFGQQTNQMQYGQHGYNFTVPDTLKDGKTHAIYAYAINIGSWANNAHLWGSPFMLTCPRATPQTCGNGIREGSEQCDDGNANQADYCAYCRSNSPPPPTGYDYRCCWNSPPYKTCIATTETARCPAGSTRSRWQ